MIKKSLLCVTLIAGVAGAALAEKVGEIIFLDGIVEVLRGEQTLTESDLDVGAPIENLDRIRTGQDGQVTIALASGQGAAAEMRVAARTTFYVEIDRVERRSSTTLGLMAGSIGLKVKKAGGGREIAVRTETATMGARGTDFEVALSPAGDVLVTTSEGTVACSDETKGGELLCEPGQVVELRIEESTFRAIPVAVSSLQQFRREWIAGRIEAFRANALLVTRSYAQRYERLLGEFNSAYEDLVRNSAVLAKWAREERSGAVGGTMDLMREKRAVVGDLLRLRKTLFLFERVYYRLIELEGYYNEGLGRGNLRPGLTAEQFWRQFNADRRELAARMGRVRWVAKEYARRNDGQLPVEF